jgi:CO dehydrogenase maturation factor
MSYLIAVAGKGGTGKSTVSAFLVRLLLEEGIRPVLAVDADPNSTLGPLLGVQPGTTIGEIREEVLKEKASITGIPKERLLEMKLEECIHESNGFDLLTMGRPEGPDCYCYINNLLRGALTRLRSNYRAIVVDNEAGMEHLSRMNMNVIDSLVMVCEPTVVSARAAARIAVLVDSLPVSVRRRVLVWNKVEGSEPPNAPRALLAGERFDDTILLPEDDGVAQLSVEEKSVMGMAIPERFTALLKVYANGPLAAVKG